ncbi:MAG: AraC family transcriptional regulator [Chitinophagaceae bacterium]
MLETVYIRAGDHLDLQETVSLPATLQASVIPADATRYFSASSCACMLQERKGTDGTLLHLTARASENITVELVIQTPTIFLVLAENHTSQLITEKGETQLMCEYSFNLAYQPATSWQLCLQKDTQHTIIFITYPIASLHKLAGYYPMLPPFINAIPKAKSLFLSPVSRIASQSLANSIHTLVHKQYDNAKNLYSVFHEARSYDVLIEALDGLSAPPPAMQQILKKQQDFTTIYNIRKLIAAQPEKRPGLPELARVAGWNKDKLAKGFRQVYNMSVMEFFHQVQMEHAKKLVESTDLSIKEISSLLGLLNQNFSRNFRQYYGKTPMHFRTVKNKNHSN